MLADCLFLIGQAMAKIAAGDDAGGNEDLAAAYRLVPPAGIDEILRMVRAGEIPPPQFSRPEVARVLIESMRTG